MTERIPVILDTDAGVDDAAAIMYLLNDPAVDVKAITTVSGNVSVDKVNRNVGILLGQDNLDIPIYPGAALPLWGALSHSEDIMSADGLGGFSLGYNGNIRPLEAENAAAALVRLSKQYAGHPGFTIIAIGPLTNIALAVLLDAGFAGRVAHLVIMGGAVEARGNISAAAEFNIYVDPEAAAAVFAAGFADIKVIPWETCLKAPVPWQVYDRFAALPGPRGQAFGAITRGLAVMQREQFYTQGYILPDLLAVAVAGGDEVIGSARQVFMEVDTGHSAGRALTAVRWPPLQGHTPNASVIEDVNLELILQRMEAALNRA